MSAAAAGRRRGGGAGRPGRRYGAPDDGPTGELWGYVWTSDGEESYGILPW